MSTRLLEGGVEISNEVAALAKKKIQQLFNLSIMTSKDKAIVIENLEMLLAILKSDSQPAPSRETPGQKAYRETREKIRKQDLKRRAKAAGKVTP